jgi:hypothetical protein
MARRIIPFALAALFSFSLFASSAVAGVVDNGEVGEGKEIESIDSVKRSDGEIATESPTFLFAPRVASVQVDLLKLGVSFDLYGNITIDLFRLGPTRFGIHSAAYSHGDFCIPGVGGQEADCDRQGIADHLDLLAHVSWHYPVDAESNALLRLSAMAGAGYVEGYRKWEGPGGWENAHDEGMVPKMGAAAQLRLFDVLTLTLDYTLAIGWHETMREYIPLGLRIGYTGW